MIEQTPTADYILPGSDRLKPLIKKATTNQLIKSIKSLLIDEFNILKLGRNLIGC